jgi:hypothetical protein
MELPPFEELAEMAKSDPEALEQLRQELSEALIASAPESAQARLRGLQFQIDAQRRAAKNPVAACIRISAMMHDSLQQLNRVLQDGDTGLKQSADLLPFKR